MKERYELWLQEPPPLKTVSVCRKATVVVDVRVWVILQRFIVVRLSKERPKRHDSVVVNDPAGGIVFAKLDVTEASKPEEFCLFGHAERMVVTATAS